MGFLDFPRSTTEDSKTIFDRELIDPWQSETRTNVTSNICTIMRKTSLNQRNLRESVA